MLAPKPVPGLDRDRADIVRGYRAGCERYLDDWRWRVLIFAAAGVPLVVGSEVGSVLGCGCGRGCSCGLTLQHSHSGLGTFT